MGITGAQRESRARGIGASEVPALFGMHGWLNERELWLLKTGRVVQPEETNEAIEIGNDFEQPLIGWCKKLLEDKLPDGGTLRFKRNVERRSKTCPHLLVHLDAAILGTDMHVEAKTTGKVEQWDETDNLDPTDAVPPAVVIQTQAQFSAAETRVCYVPVLMPGFVAMQRRLYRVVRDDDVVQMIEDRVSEWWLKHIDCDEEPEGEPPRRRILKLITRTPKAWTTCGDAFMSGLLAARDAAEDAGKVRDRYENEAISRMGLAEGLRAPDALHPEFTYFEQAGHLTRGQGPEFWDTCPECLVGQKRGRPFRTLRKRKRTGLGKGKK